MSAIGLPSTKQILSKNSISTLKVDNDGLTPLYPKLPLPRHQLAINNEVKKSSAGGKNTLSKKRFIPPSFKAIFKTKKSDKKICNQ